MRAVHCGLEEEFMHPSAVGFAKQAGLKQFAGRALKGVGRLVGSEELTRKGLVMQHGRKSLVTGGSILKAKPRPKVPVPSKPPAGTMELVIPHGTPRVERDLMLGRSKAKHEYVTSYRGRGG